MKDKKNILIIGASSGIGNQIARIYAEKGYKLTICARRMERLKELADEYPGQMACRYLDVSAPDAASTFMSIIEALPHPDIIINCAGIGKYNPDLDCDTDMRTIATDCSGFVAIADTAFNYYAKTGKTGHFAAISSIAGVRSLGVALSYSASKRFQNAYLEGLDQLRRMRKIQVRITDIRPGFAATDLLDKQHKYPMQMQPEHVARIAVKAISRNKRVVVIDWRYKILVALWRLIPRCLWVRLPIKL